MSFCEINVKVDEPIASFGDKITGTIHVHILKRTAVTGLEVGLLCLETVAVHEKGDLDHNSHPLMISRRNDSFRSCNAILKDASQTHGKKLILEEGEVYDYQFELQVPSPTSDGNSPYPSSTSVPKSNSSDHLPQFRCSQTKNAVADVCWSVYAVLTRSRRASLGLVSGLLKIGGGVKSNYGSTNIEIVDKPNEIVGEGLSTVSESGDLAGKGGMLKCTLNVPNRGIVQTEPIPLALTLCTTAQSAVRVSTVSINLEEKVTTGFENETTGRRIENIHDFSHTLYAKSYSAPIHACNAELEEDLKEVFINGTLHPSSNSMYIRREYFLTANVTVRAATGAPTTIKVSTPVTVHPKYSCSTKAGGV